MSVVKGSQVFNSMGGRPPCHPSPRRSPPDILQHFDSGAVVLAEGVPFVVPEADITVLCFRDRRTLRTIEHLMSGTTFVMEPRPDEMGDFED
jgi:hypothetical protein